jgi:hypothetical protein
VLLLIKLLPSLVALLGAQQLLSDALAPHLPARVLSALLTNTCADPELACGAKLCTLVSAVAGICAKHMEAFVAYLRQLTGHVGEVL